MIKNIKKYIYILCLSLIAACIIRGIGYMMPNQAIQRNINLSMNEINRKGLYPHFGWDFNEWEATNQIDNYTEYVVLNHVYLLGNSNFLESFINNPCAIYETTDPLETLNSIISSQDYTMENKIQYWWGISSVFSILLTLFTYPQMILFVQLVILILVSYLSFLLYKEFKANLVYGFIIMLFLIKLNIASNLLVTSSVFIVSFVIAILILNYKRYNPENLNKWMFIAGINTAFWDWLSTPVFSCSFLGIICFLLLVKYNSISNEIKKVLYSIGFCIYWGIGYGSMLFSKWIIAAIYEGNIWGVVKQRIGHGVDNKVDWAPTDTFSYIVATLKENLFNINILKIAQQNSMFKDIMIVSSVIIIISMILFRKKYYDIGKIISLVLFGSVPFVWFIVFKGHSFVHHWFTYRSLGATFFSIWILYNSSIEKQRIADCFSKLRIRK